MSGLKFLLLEDSLLDAELIQIMLTEGGIVCELVHLKTATEFQTALEIGGFDLILSDYSLPGFDGIAALEMAQQKCPDIPFIFVTATMGEEVAIETVKSGATDYVLKQRLRRLVPSVQRALREAQERRARKKAEQGLRASEAQLRQQKEELLQANRVKDEFLAVLSHELRSPLNAILGWSKLLRTRKLDPTNFNRALETIERNAKLQTQLIEDLLDISGIIRGKLTLSYQPTNLISAIEAALDTMRLAAQAKSVDLHFLILDDEWENDKCVNSQLSTQNLKSKIQSSQFHILGDPNRLQQIIWNLLSNAIKFTPQGGRVDVSLCVEKNDPKTKLPNSKYAQITVKDTGIGINANFLPYVFESFRQADGSTTRKHGGLGLGLAIVRHLVELHGGTVSATSPGEGLGATFTCRIPLLEKTDGGSQGSGGATSVSSPLTGVRILVVDDEADSRDFLVFVLENCGAITTAVTSVSSALKVLGDFKADVLISDIGMAGEDGYALIRQVRALPPTQGGLIPAIALTAYAGENDRKAAMAAGFQIHMSKPVMPDELANVITELIS